MDLESHIRTVEDFPEPGVLFRDITPLLASPEAVRHVLDEMERGAHLLAPSGIVGIESRGFIFGMPLADRMRLPFVPVRKPGKLPAKRMSVEYSLEYGQSQLDIHADALTRGDTALVVDDLLATGGTARATAKLVELLGATVVGFSFVIELSGLGGRGALEGYRVSSLVVF
ncbi:MAG: adenine phosphoribosyltransferase [Dehalococcoidia bacterium]